MSSGSNTVNMQESQCRIVIYLVLDVSASMRPQLQACIGAMSEFVAMTKLMPQLMMRVVAFSDYCDNPTCVISPVGCDLVRFVENIKILYGGDIPEAHKTAYFTVLQAHIQTQNRFENQELPGLLLCLTDAPPHSFNAGEFTSRSALNDVKEQTWFADRQASHCWIDICRQLSAQKIVVAPLIFNDDHIANVYHANSAYLTSGVSFRTSTRSVEVIRQQMLGIVLNYLGLNATIPETTAYTVNVPDQSPNVSSEDTMLLYQSQDQPDIKSILNLTNADFAVDRQRIDYYIQVMMDLMSAGKVESISDNNIFSGIWRQIVACRLTNQLAVENLLGHFGNATERLSPAARAKMQAWLEESYDRTEDVVAPIKNHIRSLDDTSVSTYYTNDSGMNISQRDFIAMLRDLDAEQYPEFFAVAATITEKTMGKYEALQTECIVPADYENFWSVVGHLFVPGTLVSSRRLRGCLCLLLAAAENCVLTAMAKQWLLDNIGLWVDRSDRRCYCYQMASIAVANKQYFTDTEIAIYMRIYGTYRVNGCINNLKLEPYDVRGDFSLSQVNETLYHCQHCGDQRPATFMVGTMDDMKCVACTWVSGEQKEYRDALPTQKVNLYSACSLCGDYYSRITETANAAPKCHYCRTDSPKTGCHVVCKTCDGSRVYPLLACGVSAARTLLGSYEFIDGVYYVDDCPLCNHISLTQSKTVTYKVHTVPDLRQRSMDRSGVHWPGDKVPNFCNPELDMTAVESVQLANPVPVPIVVETCVADMKKNLPRHHLTPLSRVLTSMFETLPVVGKCSLPAITVEDHPTTTTTDEQPEEHPCVFVASTINVYDFMEYDTPVFGGRPFSF